MRRTWKHGSTIDLGILMWRNPLRTKQDPMTGYHRMTINGNQVGRDDTANVGTTDDHNTRTRIIPINVQIRIMLVGKVRLNFQFFMANMIRVLFLIGNRDVPGYLSIAITKSTKRSKWLPYTLRVQPKLGGIVMKTIVKHEVGHR